jgi:hypothetical protein
MFYFDPSGASLSITGGLQNYYQGQNYYFMIKSEVPSTSQQVNITYTVMLDLPSGQNPIATIQYDIENLLFYMKIMHRTKYLDINLLT